jgi:hypothetical protein
VPLLLFVPGPTLPELDGAELPVPAPTMPDVPEPEMPVVLFMDPPVRPISPGPDPLVVAELLVGPLSDPPLPWLDCANAGNAASDNTQATRTVFFIIVFSIRNALSQQVAAQCVPTGRGQAYGKHLQR